MHLRLEPTSGVPLGLQIVRQLRLAVASGRLRPGEQLPSARDLSARLQVNFHTVRKAYGDLEREGVVRFERGKGTFVVDPVRAMDPAALSEVVRDHIERLAEDLAGAKVTRAQVERIVRQEIHRVFVQSGARLSGVREDHGP